MFEPGTIVDHKYRVDRLVGSGGMGIVVAATHLQLGTQVALKCLNASRAANPTMAARLLREAKATAQLRNEHICQVLDVGNFKGMPYIVMELLEGTDLSSLIKRTKLDIVTIVDYVRQACSGIAEAHARQIIHRDLKPSNLFLTRRADGSPLIKVFDFGVAKAPVDIGHRLTESVQMVGSPAYMSPEQIASSRDVDARTDVWSLGVILYRMIAGRPPFEHPSLAELARQITNSPPAALTAAPHDLAKVIARCLEKNPDDRFQSVGELSLALRPFSSEVRETTVQRDRDHDPEMDIATALHMPDPPTMQPLPFRPIETTEPDLVEPPEPRNISVDTVPERPKRRDTTGAQLAAQRMATEQIAPRQSVAPAAIIIGAGTILGIIAVVVMMSRPAAKPSRAPTKPAPVLEATSPVSAQPAAPVAPAAPVERTQPIVPPPQPPPLEPEPLAADPTAAPPQPEKTRVKRVRTRDTKPEQAEPAKAVTPKAPEDEDLARSRI